MMIFDKYVPTEINNSKFGFQIFLNNFPELHYASRGRWALYHTLLSLDLKSNDSVLLPAYICKTVLEPLHLLNLKPIFYDISLDDLNPDIGSIETILLKHDVKAVLVPSMYGYPANMIDIEKICKHYSVAMIDDAAQSFGATLEGKNVGMFGDAGFFSFSPGKPTSAHMGAFFWSFNKSYHVKRTFHPYIHRWMYYDFYFNRLNIYKYRKYKVFKLLIFSRIMFRIFDIKNDEIELFEKDIIGGVFNQLQENISRRRQIINDIKKLFPENKYYRLITGIRGEPSPHKIIIVSNLKEKASKLIDFLLFNKIYAQKGYSLLTKDLEGLNNSKVIDQCVVEIPMEINSHKMNYLKDKLFGFIKKEDLFLS